MIAVEIDKIISVVNGRLIAGDRSGSVRGVSIDSRTVGAGELFFAIRGERFDGHDYAAAALAIGAACVVVERAIEVPGDCGGAVVIVDDTVAALGRLAAWYRQQLAATVIAITGSAGKTTTRQMLHAVLSGFYRCRQAPKSFNNQIGVPLTLLSAEAEDAILLVEIGTNHPGEIAPLSRMVNPDAAVVTFVGPAHLEGFRTLDNILKEKISIAEGLRADGTLYVNGDQPELAAAARERFAGRIVTFGTNDKCDVIGTDFQMHGDCGSFVVDGQRVHVPLPGRASLMNVLTVLSICADLKVGLSDCVEVIGRLKPVSMRMEVVRAGAFTILNDCYNANPASMANALECLAGFDTNRSRRRVFIAGTMRELGEQSAMLHRQLGQRAADAGVNVLLAVGAFAEQTAAGARAARPDIQVETFENTDRLCNNLHKTIRADDIILVKGSRAAGLEKAVEIILKCKMQN